MKSKQVRSEENVPYDVGLSSDEEIIARAIAIIDSRMHKPAFYITSPDTAADYLKLRLANLDHEIFAVLFLDNRHGVIAYDELSRGTIDGAAVYPREIVKESLRHNAAAVILAHNHPSGNPEPSNADKRITARIKEALALVDIRTLDHLVVGSETTSFADLGLI